MHARIHCTHRAVEKIRKAIETGCDTSVCLLNYTAAGEKFFNQFFIAALRDAQGRIVNFVGVQCKVSEEFVQAVQKQEENDDGVSAYIKCVSNVYQHMWSDKRRVCVA